jgi:Tol biopolymer transport system component
VTLADGTHDRVVWRGPVYAFGWSGGDDLLAVTPRSGGLVVLDPKGSTRTLVPSTALVFSFAWSSQGTSLAYSVAHRAPDPDEVRIVDAATGESTHVAFGPGPDVGVVLGKWWPDDHGLLWWIDPSHSTVLEEDGLMLQSVPLGGRPVDLITTDVYLPWLAWSPDGATLAVVTGGTRLPWEGKRLALCQPRQATCTRLAQPPGAVALDPAWSRDGSRLAFVRAAERGSAGAGTDLASWYASRRLWTSAPDGSGAVEVAGAGPGVAAPVWLQPDVVGYSTAGGINVISPGSGQAITIAGNLNGGSGAGPDAHGKQPWGGIAVWRP